MKKFIAGFLTCLILSGVVYATERFVGERATFKVVVNNVEKVDWLDVPPIVVEGRTMLPLRSIADALNETVKFDEEAQAVLVGQMPEAGVYDGLEITILNHGIYNPNNKQIGVDIILKNVSDKAINFKCTNFLFDGRVPVGYESNEIRGTLKDMHRLMPGSTYNLKLLYKLEDVGGIILTNKRPYRFYYDQIVCSEVSKRIEILYHH